jgi:hypothetical protein
MDDRTPPTLTDLIRHALAALLATLSLPEAAEQLRDGTLRWATAAELLLTWAQQPLLNPKTPGRLAAGARAADALGRDDVEGAAAALAACEGITAESWALIALDRWQGLRCEGCDQTWGTPEAAERAGCLTAGGGWVICADCRSPEPEPTPPEPTPPAPTAPPRRAPRPAPARADAPVAALVEAAGCVATPADAVSWWAERSAELESLPRAARDAVRTALARRVVEVGGGGTKSLPAARGFLSREIAAALRTAPGAVIETRETITEVTEPTPARELVLVRDDAELVLARFAAKVADVTLPSEAGALWLAQREALARLPRADAERAFHALCKHLEDVAHMDRAKFWLKRFVAEHDAPRADADVPAMAGAA